MKTPLNAAICGVVGLLSSVLIGQAAPATAVSIETVLVANPGNAADSVTGYGAVAYNYRIGTTEVTNSQYVTFLNSVAASDTYGAFPVDPYNLVDQYGIVRSGSPGSYSYAVKPAAIGKAPDGGDYAYGDKPVMGVTGLNAMRFANWLHNGQPTGAQDASTTEDGAYTLNGATAATAIFSIIARNPGANWYLPSADEWYKAAYYDPNKPGGAGYWEYATRHDDAPISVPPSGDTGNAANSYYATGVVDYLLTDVGAYSLSVGPYGTLDQAGNVPEWTDSQTMMEGVIYDPETEELTFTDLAFAAVARNGHDDIERSTIAAFDLITVAGRFTFGGHMGFRVVTVPEPSTWTLAAIGLTALVTAVRRRRSCARP